MAWNVAFYHKGADAATLSDSASGKFDVWVVNPMAPRYDETRGGKFKFWYDDPQLGRSLFKRGRERTGENWSEKVACELATLLSLPCARVELAQCGPSAGVVSPTFLPALDDRLCSLILGNEIMVRCDPNYPRLRRFHATHYTLPNVLSALERTRPEVPLGWCAFPPLNDWRAVFAGYLLLDAWIGNTDRHHENWAIVRAIDAEFLAPTFDHASSLGRELTDETRISLMTSRDQTGDLSAYAGRCRSAFFAEPPSKRLWSTFKAFTHAAGFSRLAARQWLSRLGEVEPIEMEEVLHRVPGEFISEPARSFALGILVHNRARLLGMRSEL